MKRLALFFVFLLAAFSAWAGTNLPPATALLLGEKKVLELTDRLAEYQNSFKVPGKLTSIGSGVPTILINRWASEFAKLHPETELDIKGGGSVDGLTQLLNGQADIVPMSQFLPADYIARFKAKFGYQPGQMIVAQDAVGVYVNKNNSLQELTLAQLDAIYSRDARRGGGRPELWRDVGVDGPLADRRILRVSLSRVHGTYMFLQSEVMRGAEYRFDVQFEIVPSSLVQAVGADDAAIGCSSVIFATARTRFVPLQAADGHFLLPTYENTVSRRYPLVRPMIVVFNRRPNGSMNPAAREFLRFAVSRRGQLTIALAVSYPITPEQQHKALQAIK